MHGALALGLALLPGDTTAMFRVLLSWSCLAGIGSIIAAVGTARSGAPGVGDRATKHMIKALSTLSQAEWGFFLKGAEQLRYKKGETVIREGDTQRALYASPSSAAPHHRCFAGLHVRSGIWRGVAAAVTRMGLVGRLSAMRALIRAKLMVTVITHP